MSTHAVNDVVTRLDAARDAVRARLTAPPVLGIVAGSGLGAVGTLVEAPVAIPYGEIPHMPVPGVVGHRGELVGGRVGGLDVAVLSGRVHRYEGHPLDHVVFGVRLLARLGATSVLLTNAAGGVAPWLGPGALCRLVDHLNFTGDNPLFGPNLDALGPRFPDMSHPYDPVLGARLDAAAERAGVALSRGIYAAMPGPSYETPAEVRMLRTLGATMVGMSTVPETIALRHMDVRVAGISVISNAAAGMSPEKLDHADVKQVADEAGPRLLKLVGTLCEDLAREPLA